MTPSVRWTLLVVAVGLHLAVGPFYLASGLVAPSWAVLVLWATWVAMLVLLVRLWRRSPARGLLVPPLALVVVLLAITAGERLLGWTA